MSGSRGNLLAVNNRLKSIHAWQDRIRDPSLTALLVLELCAIFLAAPPAAKGLPIARAVADTLVLSVLVIVVMLSHRWDAIVMILIGLAAIAVSFLPNRYWSPVSIAVLRRGGGILAFSTLTWVVAHAVYATGRITFHRLQGAVVIYLSLATIFASIFGLIWELSPSAFVNLLTPVGAIRRRWQPCSISASLRWPRPATATSCRWIHSPAAWPIWSPSSGNSCSPSRLPAS